MERRVSGEPFIREEIKSTSQWRREENVDMVRTNDEP